MQNLEHEYPGEKHKGYSKADISKNDLPHFYFLPLFSVLFA